MGGLIGNHNYVTTAYPLAPILTTLDEVEGCSHAVCLSSGIFRTVVQWLTRIQLYSHSVHTIQWRQRELKVGGTSLVSRLSACLTEANWWRLIAE